MPNLRNPLIIGPQTPEEAFALGYVPQDVLDASRDKARARTFNRGWIWAGAALVAGAALWRYLKGR